MEEPTEELRSSGWGCSGWWPGLGLPGRRARGPSICWWAGGDCCWAWARCSAASEEAEDMSRTARRSRAPASARLLDSARLRLLSLLSVHTISPRAYFPDGARRRGPGAPRLHSSAAGLVLRCSLRSSAALGLARALRARAAVPLGSAPRASLARRVSGLAKAAPGGAAPGCGAAGAGRRPPSRAIGRLLPTGAGPLNIALASC
jgi:hypothetical protein